jgi:hypothetical protein
MVKPQEHKLRVARHGVGNTRARRTNTANRAPNMPMHHGHGFIPVCTISILWNSHTTPCHPSENYELHPQGHRHRTTTRTQITSCTARAGQHARPTHKHCKPCAKHAHAPRPRVHTGLHDFHLVEFSYHPVPSQ